MRTLTMLAVTLLVGCSGTLNVGHSSTGSSGSATTGSSTGGSTGSTTGGGACTQGGEICAVHGANTCCAGIACSARSSNDGFCCNDLGGTCASNAQCCGDLVCANGVCSGGGCFNANCDPGVPCCVGSFCSGFSGSVEGSCVPAVADAGCPGTDAGCSSDQLCCPWEGGPVGGAGYTCAAPTVAGNCPVLVQPGPDATFPCGLDGGCSASTQACVSSCFAGGPGHPDPYCDPVPVSCQGSPTCDCVADAGGGGIGIVGCTEDGGVSYELDCD